MFFFFISLIYFNCASAFLRFQLEVVRSRNVQCLSFPLTVATLFTSTSWVLYGLQVSDLYIVVRLTYLCCTFSTAPNKYFSFIKQKCFPLFASLSGPKRPRNHHQPHQTLSVLEIWICFSRLTFLQAYSHMRRVRKDQQTGIKGCGKLLPPVFLC